MNTYIISVDIENSQNGRHVAFILALERFEDRCQALETIWFISTPWSAEEVHAYLRLYLDVEATLIVEKLRIGQGWGGWMRVDVRSWLADHLGPAE